MSRPMQNPSQTMSLDQLQDAGTNIVFLFTSIFTRPLELILRPWHGSRYFSPIVIFLSSALMLLLPAFTATTQAVVGMIPFGPHFAVVPGFDIASLAKLYFMLSFFHGIRIYRRMIKPETELHSGFEGPPLPVFDFLPWGNRFFFVRIVLEPAAVFILATILANFHIITPGLATFLHFSALCLVMKEFIDWYQCWLEIRSILDARNAGPLIAKLIDNTATENEKAALHVASFPKNLTPELRKETVMHIARAYDVHLPNNES
jgi:hypothetical protein